MTDGGRADLVTQEGLQLDLRAILQGAIPTSLKMYSWQGS